MLARVLAVVVCVYLSHPVLCQNDCTDQADFLCTGFPGPMLHGVLGKLGCLQIKVLPLASLSQTLDLENFATWWPRWLAISRR